MTSKKPNVLVFFTDQQRYDTLGVHGNPLDLTPNLDRMAQHGTHFEYAFTPNPVCAPTRSSMQTGLFPTSTGVHVNGLALGKENVTIAEAFNRAGYRTGYIGKWHLAPSEPVTEEYRGGYSSWLGANVLEFSSDEYHTIVWDEQNQPVMLPGYRADGLVDAIVRFIADNHDEPFMLFSSFIEPHHQNERDDYPAPHGYAERYTGRWTPPDLAALGGTAHEQLAGYYGQIKRLDECLGRVNDALRSLGLLEDTIVVFTSDHGSHFKTRNGEYKRSCHEASIRVPLVISGGSFTAGGRRPELISTVDVPATLFDIAGMEDLDALHGRSLLPLVNRQIEAGDWRDSVFVQISESQLGRAIRTERWKYAITAPEKSGREASSDAYEEDALYDLYADPYELHNLINEAQFDDIAADLRNKMKAHILRFEGIDAVIRPACRDMETRRPETFARANPVQAVRFGHQPSSVLSSI